MRITGLDHVYLSVADFAPGLHHLCLQVASAADVDDAYRALRALGVAATEPRVAARWGDFTDFLNPMAKLRERERR